MPQLAQFMGQNLRPMLKASGYVQPAPRDHWRLWLKVLLHSKLASL